MKLLNKIPVSIFALLGGVFYAFGFPSFLGKAFFLGTTIGIFLLIYSTERTKESFWKTLLNVLLFSFTYNLIGYYWIPHTLTVFGEIPFPFNYALSQFFAIFIVPHFWIFFILLHLFRKYVLNKINNDHSFTIGNILFALVFTLLEYFTPQQFPAHAGHPWLILAPYVGMAQILGSPSFSFLIFWGAKTFAGIILKKRIDFLFFIILGSAIIYCVLYPIAPFNKSSDNHIEKEKSINIRIAQANVGNYLKLKSETGDFQSIKKVLEFYQYLSTKPSLNPIDLIIWPETAYPFLLSSNLEVQDPIMTPFIFRKIIDKTSAAVVFGGYDQRKKVENNPDGFEKEYNSIFYVNKNKILEDVYHKHLLIPFGETLPFGPLNKHLAKIIKNVSFFAKGEKFPFFDLNSKANFISVVCYEILFSHFIREYLNHSATVSPNFIVNVTNDSWYGGTAEIFQHLFLSHWRAIEFNIPIIRSTNTGITSVLYPDGTESKRLIHEERDSLDIELPIRERPRTYFQTWGIWGLTILSFALIGFVILCLLTKAVFKKVM